MTLARFARLNQTIEFCNPTDKISRIATAFGKHPDKPLLTRILSLDYSPNNLGTKRAVKWVAASYGIFEDEIETFLDIYGDLGEAVNQFDGSGTDSDIH